MVVLDNQTKVYQRMKLLGSVSVVSLSLSLSLSYFWWAILQILGSL